MTFGTAILLGFAIVVLAVLPLILSAVGQTYLFRLAQLGSIMIILAVSLNLLTGTLGLLSLAHASFYGLGAYISALLAVKLGLPFPVTLLASGVFTALLAGIMAVSISRLVRLFFAVGTLAIGELIGLALLNWTDLTNGPMGVRGIPSAQIFDRQFTSPLEIYYVCAVTMLVCVWFVHRITHSYFGTALRAAREDDQAAAGMGLPGPWLKIFAFATSAGVAGIAGSLLAHTTNFISPDMFRLGDSIFILTMVVIGGLGSVMGAVLGAILLVLLPEVTRDLGQLRMLLVGVVLFISIVALPQGLVSEIRSIALVRKFVGKVRDSARQLGLR
jgi:branched-chain amino acid transport system permease protein